MQIENSIILKHLARHAMERAFKAQNLAIGTSLSA
jgi:hypothetical protein